MRVAALLLLLVPLGLAAQPAAPVQRIRYNNPGLVVDLGVGLWATPFPMDYDGDGDWDLVVLSGGVPDEGTYLFRNPGCAAQPCIMPVFEPPVRIAGYVRNAQISYVHGEPRVLSPGFEYPRFRERGFQERVPLGITTEQIYPGQGRIRANQWRWVDYDGDDRLELVVGIGD